MASMATDFFLERSDDGERVVSITEFTRRVKAVLETGVPPCWVRGEVSNFRRQSSGHCYFSLKDENSQLPCVLFRGNAARVELDLRDGMQVIAFGEVSVYEPRGAYQMIVRQVLEDGLGKLQREFERLKQKLAAEGLFDPARKRPIPKMPAVVGFITSPTGAAAQDFIRILKRRGWWGRVVLLPVRVQGREAAPEMISMLESARDIGGFDALVIGRGGGSLEDLWAFNDEALVRAVAACPLPLISAVGHEIDFTLCDFAADLRAETPSAAAEVISSGFIECRDRLVAASEAIGELVDRRIREETRELEIFRRRLAALSPKHRVEHGFLRLDDLANRVAAAIRSRLHEKGRRLAVLESRLAQATPANRLQMARQKSDALRSRYRWLVRAGVRSHREHLQSLAKRLQSLGPESVLKRGFALVHDSRGRPVTRREGIAPGTKLINRFADGELPVRVEGADKGS